MYASKNKNTAFFHTYDTLILGWIKIITYTSCKDEYFLCADHTYMPNSVMSKSQGCSVRSTFDARKLHIFAQF